MSEYTEEVLDGFLCEECGGFIDGKSPGHPRKCKECREGK